MSLRNKKIFLVVGTGALLRRMSVYLRVGHPL